MSRINHLLKDGWYILQIITSVRYIRNKMDQSKQSLIDSIYYLRLAYNIAAKSPDKSNQNGAILVTKNDQIIKDCNRFPNNLNVTEDMITNRQKKYFYIEHAERNVIFKAIRQGINPTNCIMYCPWFACADCARAIILSDIKTVVGHQARMDTTPERWKISVQQGLKMMKDCGVNLIFYNKPIQDCISILVNGNLWNPNEKVEQ